MWEVVKDSACSHWVLFVCCVPLCGHLLHLPELNTCKISHLILKHLSYKEQRSATHLHGVITTQCPPPHLNKCQSGWSRHNFFNNAIPLLPELQLPHSHHSTLHSSYIPIRVHPDGRQPHHQHPPPPPLQLCGGAQLVRLSPLSCLAALAFSRQNRGSDEKEPFNYCMENCCYGVSAGLPHDWAQKSIITPSELTLLPRHVQPPCPWQRPWFGAAPSLSSVAAQRGRKWRQSGCRGWMDGGYQRFRNNREP